MKFIRPLIKGILITAFALAAFSFNPAQLAHSTIEIANYQVESSIRFTDHFVPKALAADPKKDGKPAAAAEIPNTLIQTIAKASSLINTIFNPLIYFLTKHIGNLLSNDYIYGGNMGKMLQSIWVVSRNIVNIVFVLMLLFMALKHIFSSDESSDLKKSLPLFVLVMVAVNFSWLGSKLVLDAANVATNVAFAIPSGVKGVALKTETKKCELKKDPKTGKVIGTQGSCALGQIWMPFGSTENNHLLQTDCAKTIGSGKAKKTVVADGYDKAYNADGKGGEDKKKPYYGKTTFCWKPLEIDKFSRSNAAYHLTYGMAKVQDITKANTGNSISKVGIGTLFSVFIQIVYIIAFGSLFIALVARVAFLWLLVAFSPFIVLMYVLKSQSINIGQEIESYFSFGAFANWAFAPTKVAAVWSVGFIMITAGQTSTTALFTTLNQQGQITSRVFSVNSLFLGMDTIQEFIWLIMTIGIVWIGTFAVLTKLQGIQGVMDSINTYGKNMAREVATSPKWAPIIPMLDSKEGVKFKSWAKSGFDPLKSIREIKSNYTGPDPTSKFREVSKKIRTNDGLKRKINEYAKDGGDIPKLYGALKTVGLSKEDMTKYQKEVERVLTGAGVSGAPDLAAKIKKYAEGKPDTVDPNRNNKKTPGLKESEVKRAMVEALKEHDLHENKDALKKLEDHVKEKGIKTKEGIKAAAKTIAKEFKNNQTQGGAGTPAAGSGNQQPPANPPANPPQQP